MWLSEAHLDVQSYRKFENFELGHHKGMPWGQGSSSRLVQRGYFFFFWYKDYTIKNTTDA